MRYIFSIFCLLLFAGASSQFVATTGYSGIGGAVGAPEVYLIDSLFAYYSFEEAAGDALDSHNSYDLDVAGPTVEQAGIIDYCYTYTTNDYVGHEDNDDFDFTGTFSVSCWFSTTEAVAWKSIVSNYGDATHGWEIIHSPNYPYWRLRWVTGDVAISGDTDINGGDWYHLAASYNAVDDTMKLWINGELDDDPMINANGVDYSAGCRLTIGSALLAAYFEGYIDEVGIWRGWELTHVQVDSLYNLGSGLAYPFN